MYDGTITMYDPECVDRWELPGGLLAYLVADTTPDSPREWDNVSAFVRVDDCTGNAYAAESATDAHEAIERAVGHFGRDYDKITRYLRIYGDAAAVDYVTMRDYTMWGMVTNAAASAELGPEEDDLATRAARCLKGDFEAYQAWAEGEVYGVIVTNPAKGTEASLFGVYDLPRGYVREVAIELAAEVSE